MEWKVKLGEDLLVKYLDSKNLVQNKACIIDTGTLNASFAACKHILEQNTVTQCFQTPTQFLVERGCVIKHVIRRD